MQTEVRESHTARVSAFAPVLLALDPESMQMIVAPGESRLKDVVELGKSDVAADQQASPDQGANAAEGNFAADRYWLVQQVGIDPLGQLSS